MHPVVRAVLPCVLLGSCPSHGHHSLAAVYDASRPMTVTGTVKSFAFIHPHPFLTLEVGSGAGVETWRLEFDNRFELDGIGMTADTLRPGDRVVVTGSPGRVDRLALYVRRLQRPDDGLEYEQVGFNPRLRLPAR